MDSMISYYRYQLLERNIRTGLVLPNLFAEFLLRVLLALVVVVVWMHSMCQPRARLIAAEEMLDVYKRPRKESYVPPWAMVLSVLLVPFVIFSLPLVCVRNYSETTEALLGWSLSLLVTANITELLKILVSRPRPDFFYRCFPCGTVSEQLHCMGSVQDVIEGRKSFPSGHTSVAFCSLGFLSLWLNGKLTTARMTLRVEILSVLPLVLATLIGVSRCCDNHHHWEDVAAGALLGFTSSYVCYKLYCKPSDHIC